MVLIGIDCATDPRNTGLAMAACEKGTLTVLECKLGSRNRSIAEELVTWVQSDQPRVVAVDAPLGWPAEMGRVLASHRAGRPIRMEANALFRRHTDLMIRAKLRKNPLEVGADRIARTALAALSIVSELGGRLGEEVRLAWSHRELRGVQVIEVYPAGTLIAHQIDLKDYRKRDPARALRVLLESLREYCDLRLARGVESAMSSEHVIDALVCVLAAADFVSGQAICPEPGYESTAARKEGWIWVKDPARRQSCAEGGPTGT